MNEITYVKDNLQDDLEIIFCSEKISYNLLWNFGSAGRMSVAIL